MSGLAAAPTRYVEHVMGMPISLALRGCHTDDGLAGDVWASVMASLRETDAVFSTYRPDSWISRLGRGEVALRDCPPEVAEVLALAEVAHRESAGAFSVWLPGPEGERRLDPSGVVKGWAVDRAATVLDALPETDSCLSAGGDLVCRTGTGRAPWRIGIEDPREPTRIVATVEVGNGAVATSGTAHRGEHVVDPRTGYAPAGVASVTVVGPKLTWADIDATAAYVHGPDAARWLAGRRDTRGHRALVVWGDGSTDRV